MRGFLSEDATEPEEDYFGLFMLFEVDGSPKTTEAGEIMYYIPAKWNTEEYTDGIDVEI